MKSLKKTSIAIVLSVAMLSLSGITFMPAATATPTTFTVNVTTDEVDANAGDGTCETANAGECTLRAAIEEANANAGIDTIEFNVSGTGVHAFQPGSSFPTITETLTIDGYTNNPGANSNTAISPAPLNSVINIEIDGQSTGSNVLSVNDSTTNATIRGISIHSCPDRCIDFEGPSPILQGSYIGVDATGLNTPILSERGVVLRTNASSGLVGGNLPENRNVITGGVESPGVAGLIMSGVIDGEVYGNYIGIGSDGETDLDGMTGAILDGANGVQIGGPGVGQPNLISGNSLGQLATVFSSNAKIQGNFVGVDADGNVNSSITNGAGLIMQLQTVDSLVGGTNAGEGNLVAGTAGLGISILSGEGEAFGFTTLEVTNVAVLGNTISDIGIFDYPNFGTSNQGLDLQTFNMDGLGNITFSEQGVTPNDTNDSDDGPNGNINFPLLTSAVQTGTQLDVAFDLDAADSTSGDYRIEFFANDTSTIFGHGPGQTYLGSTTVQNGTDLQASLTLPSGLDVTSKSLSATTTAENNTTTSGFGATSEFSKNILIGSDTDTDADTIPDAIENAVPNSGDGNNDGIQDSTQPTVSSFVSATSGLYTTFVTSGCSSNAYVTSIAEASLGATDDGFQYPYGLTDFILNCSLGDTVTVDKYVFTPETDVTDFSVRKYRPGTHTFEAVPDSTVISETIGGQHALHLNYSVTDGSAQDDDGEANGIIVDPVGLAEIYVASQSVTNPDTGATASGTLPATGNTYDWQTPIILMELGLILLVLTLNPKKRYAKR